MKKSSILLSFLTSICLLLTTVNLSFAQSVKTGAKGGISFAKFSGDGVDTESITGYMIGGFVKMDFSGSPIAIQPEIYYSRKGADTGNGEIKLDYFEVPILAKFGLVPGGPVSPNVFVGPYAAINLQQSSSGGLLGGGGNSPEEIDFGGVLGAGVDFEAGSSIFTLDLRYSFGLTNVYNSGDAKNSVFAITAGISLPG